MNDFGIYFDTHPSHPEQEAIVITFCGVYSMAYLIPPNRLIDVDHIKEMMTHIKDCALDYGREELA